MPFLTAIPGGIELRHRHEVVRIEAWGVDSVRVRAGRFRIDGRDVGALAEAAPLGTDPVVTDQGATAILVNGGVTVLARLSDDANPEILLEFARTSDGVVVLGEQRVHPWAPGARTYAGNRTGAYALVQEFAAHEGERLYGMGQRTHGRFDLKGLALDLVQRNGEVNIPFVLSDRGYGFLWNNPAVGRVEFSDNATRWSVGQSRNFDYWVTIGDEPRDILARYADVTGHVPRLPEWASGFWQSKLRYRDQDELLDVAREHKRRGLPLSVIVSDYFHWSAMGDYAFDPEEWPDPSSMVEELKADGVELMVSIWPTISPLSRSFADYRDGGLLVGTDQGLEFHQMIQDKGMPQPMPVGFYDPTNPATREFVWGLVRENYLAHGIRVWWLDADEPELNPADPANLSLYAGPGAEVVNIYPRDNVRMFAEGMAREGLEPTVLLTRSAWAGSQKYGAAVWSGDIPATWESLATQLRAGLNIAISGIPWWTTDIGGFHGGDSRDLAYRELMIRWFQFGVFCPLFRLHGDREPRTPTGYAQTGGPNEVWSFGDQALEIIGGLLHLRERLRPYIHEQMDRAATEGLPPMRPLFVDFPDDVQAWSVDDQFLFGPDLLVAPVTSAGVARRSVYLPAGSEWTDAFTGERHSGGQTITAAAPIERIPVFLRDGADIPIVVGG